MSLWRLFRLRYSKLQYFYILYPFSSEHFCFQNIWTYVSYIIVCSITCNALARRINLRALQNRCIATSYFNVRIQCHHQSNLSNPTRAALRWRAVIVSITVRYLRAPVRGRMQTFPSHRTRKRAMYDELKCLIQTHFEITVVYSPDLFYVSQLLSCLKHLIYPQAWRLTHLPIQDSIIE